MNWHLNNGEVVVGGSELHRLMSEMSEEARKITMRINKEYQTPEKINKLFSELIGYQVDHSFRLFQPFNTDYGKNLNIGKNVFINAGCHFQDQGGITIGDNCLIGHNVVLATLNHGFAPKDRQSLYPAPITLGKNVWIGSNVTILPGVTIGENAIIGAGSVVTKDVASDTVVGGVPAKFIKVIE